MGSAIITQESVKLTGEETSQQGGVWNLEVFLPSACLPFLTGQPILADDFEIFLDLAIGSAGRLGADGMAIWITDDLLRLGNTFGGQNPWTGLGIMLDSFDNDGKGDNPAIYGLLSNGDFYDPQTDGDRMRNPNLHLGFCRAPFRSRSSIPGMPGDPFKMLIRYEKKYASLKYLFV